MVGGAPGVFRGPFGAARVGGGDDGVVGEVGGGGVDAGEDEGGKVAVDGGDGRNDFERDGAGGGGLAGSGGDQAEFVGVGMAEEGETDDVGVSGEQGGHLLAGEEHVGWSRAQAWVGWLRSVCGGCRTS